jgi:DmsE family decaheme c-type cytochrome
MKPLQHFLALGAFTGLLAFAPSVLAADGPPRDDTQAKKALARDAVCTLCHNENWRTPVLTLYQTRHGNRADPRAPNCQSCHGESSGHQKDPIGTSPEVVFGAGSKRISSAENRAAACLSCHESKILPRTNWSGSEHATRGVACTNCHDIHTPDMKVLSKATQAEVCFTCHKTQRAQIHRISAHPLATTGIGSPPKLACSDCHNPHGSTGPKLLVKQSVNETCYTCHAEKRGPFLWEHAPAVDDCTNCHTPHGSTNYALLKMRPPWLCQQCHSGDHAAAVRSGANLAPGVPGGNVTTLNGTIPFASQNPQIQANARFCLNCHVLVHGSNHPAGSKFQR